MRALSLSLVLGLSVVWPASASDLTWPFPSGGTSTQAPQIEASKLIAGGVLQGSAIESSKLIGYGVMPGASVNASKLVGYAVLESVANPAIVVRAPLTHW